MIVPTVLRGFSDEYGSWKIICISRAALERGRRWRWRSPALEADRARRRLHQAQQQARGGRLAAADSPDEAERLAAQDVERDAVDRLTAPTWRWR
jgi:hypothetical protein